MASQMMPTKILCLVVAYSFFKYFSPFESYLVSYMAQVKGLTTFQITNKVIPAYTYATLACALLVASACEYVSYKTIIVAGSFTLLAGVLVMHFGTTLTSFIVTQVASGCAAASYFIYQGYLFFLVAEEHFPTMIGYSQASTSAAYFISAELGQILVLIGISYTILLYITIAATVVTCIIAFMLPKEDSQKQNKQQFVLNFFSKDQGFWTVIKATWSEKRLQILSIWWVLATAGFELSINYSTTLFGALSTSSTYNGQVIACGTALGVLMALSSVYLQKYLAKLGGFVYIFGSLLYGALCLWLSYNRTLWVSYALFIVMVGTSKLLMCCVFAQCGSLIKNNRYTLMFSFNCGLGQAVEVVLQAVIEIAKFDIYSQYRFLGSFFLGVGVLFVILYGVYAAHSHSVEIVSPEMDPKMVKSWAVYEPLLDDETPILRAYV